MRLTFSLLLLGAAHRAHAQQVVGRVLDRESRQPVAAVVLSLHAADSSVVASTRSDTAGRWRFDVPRPGSYFIALRRVGYRPVVSPPMHVAAEGVDAVFHLQAVPVELDPIIARAAAVKKNLEYNGFYDRQRGNFGHFVSPDAIERRQAARVTDLLSAIPGVLLVATGDAGPAQVSLRAGSATGGSLCRPRVFVDGLMYTRGDARPVRVRPTNATEQDDLEQRMDRALTLDDVGHPSTIAAIEVYRSATQVPVQFGGASVETLCGVIVIWTRSGRAPDEKS